jgi:hypothetical protein
VTDGVEAAIARARELAGADRDVDVAAGEIGGQALRLGLIDEVVMNVVPVVSGGGRQFFDAMGPGDTVTLANPSRVVQGDRVTHLLYDVVGTTPRDPPSTAPRTAPRWHVSRRYVRTFGDACARGSAPRAVDLAPLRGC